MVLSSFIGCANFGRRGLSSEKAAACRELSQQAAAAMERGELQQAESLLRRALETSPNDVEAHRRLAEALWLRGNTQEAMSLMTVATKLEPTDSSLIIRSGEMALAAGASDTALIYAEQAIRTDPQLADAWVLRGRIFRRLNEVDRALADLQRALEFAPDRADVLLDVAVIYRERNQPARCLTTVHRFHDTFAPGNEPQTALVLEGLTLLELGRPQQATEVLRAASDRGPPNADLFFYLAQAHSACGRNAEATTAAQQALAINASHEGSRQLLAQLASHSEAVEPQRR